MAMDWQAMEMLSVMVSEPSRAYSPLFLLAMRSVFHCFFFLRFGGANQFAG